MRNIIGYNCLMEKSAPFLLPNPTEEKQAILAAIIASSDDTIISKTLEGVITSWNPAAERMFGYVEAEVLGRHISLIIPSERLEEETYIIGQVMQGNKIDHFETVRLAKDGTLVPISLTVSPVRSQNGVIVGASKIARDISERQKTDEKQAMLAAIIATSDDAIISKTLQGTILSWNPSAERIFGYSEKEAIGRHISLIIPLERLSEEELIISNITKGNKVDHFETVRMTKDGRKIPISVTVSPITDRVGRVIGASKIARDISERQTSQAEKAKLYDQLKELNDKKDEFIGLASHELRTPLTSISGYLQILAQRITDEKDQQFLQKARQQVGRLSSLVNDLLDVSKIEAGKLQFSIENFDIRHVVNDAIDLISHANRHYQVALYTEAPELYISGDAHRIEQVMVNLLSNAIRYSPGGDRVEVYMSQEPGIVKIGIRDFGLGIPSDKLGHVFSRFYRISDTSPNVSGLGIGLYLSHEIVTRHHGNIWAESEPGVGSTFWFTLPH
jgi:PAS domain S-box-containing protein